MLNIYENNIFYLEIMVQMVYEESLYFEINEINCLIEPLKIRERTMDEMLFELKNIHCKNMDESFFIDEKHMSYRDLEFGKKNKHRFK